MVFLDGDKVDGIAGIDRININLGVVQLKCGDSFLVVVNRVFDRQASRPAAARVASGGTWGPEGANVNARLPHTQPGRWRCPTPRCERQSRMRDLGGGTGGVYPGPVEAVDSRPPHLAGYMPFSPDAPRNLPPRFPQQILHERYFAPDASFSFTKLKVGDTVELLPDQEDVEVIANERSLEHDFLRICYIIEERAEGLRGPDPQG